VSPSGFAWCWKRVGQFDAAPLLRRQNPMEMGSGGSLADLLPIFTNGL
jgi:hypothetical protein